MFYFNSYALKTFHWLIFTSSQPIRVPWCINKLTYFVGAEGETSAKLKLKGQGALGVHGSVCILVADMSKGSLENRPQETLEQLKTAPNWTRLCRETSLMEHNSYVSQN